MNEFLLTAAIVFTRPRCQNTKLRHWVEGDSSSVLPPPLGSSFLYTNFLTLFSPCWHGRHIFIYISNADIS